MPTNISQAIFIHLVSCMLLPRWGMWVCGLMLLNIRFFIFQKVWLRIRIRLPLAQVPTMPRSTEGQTSSTATAVA